MNRFQAVRLAEAYVGSGPSAFYSYYSRNVSEFRSGDWCACFVSCILLMAGATCPGFPGLYCPTLRNAGVNAGKAVRLQDALPGDVVFFNWDGNKNADHVGIVVQWSGSDSALHTVEGNVSGRVARKIRKPNEVMSVIRPTYKEVDSLMNFVKSIQEFLQSRGYYKGYLVDGVFGKYTIMELQRYLTKVGTYDRAIDGEFGEYSRKALTKALKTGKFC